MIKIIIALIFLESGGLDTAIGDNGRAVGCLQIHKIYVDDVNRIVGHKRYHYSDRLSRRYSIEMTRIYLGYWGTRLGYTDAKTLISIHQGGTK